MHGDSYCIEAKHIVLPDTASYLLTDYYNHQFTMSRIRYGFMNLNSSDSNAASLILYLYQMNEYISPFNLLS
jgi:hypothetical protein